MNKIECSTNTNKNLLIKSIKEYPDGYVVNFDSYWYKFGNKFERINNFDEIEIQESVWDLVRWYNNQIKNNLRVGKKLNAIERKVCNPKAYNWDGDFYYYIESREEFNSHDDWNGQYAHPLDYMMKYFLNHQYGYYRNKYPKYKIGYQELVTLLQEFDGNNIRDFIYKKNRELYHNIVSWTLFESWIKYKNNIKD